MLLSISIFVLYRNQGDELKKTLQRKYYINIK